MSSDIKMDKISTQILEDSILQMLPPSIAFKESFGMHITIPIRPSIAMRRL
jgi:hypothetical protein